jgi:CheY-like chemotaxis protein
MLWFPEWRVLVVDDDPDVQRITELALRNLDVEGVPVKVFTASSKAEAIEVLDEHFTEPGGLGLLTVALIDVVMETDTAGLELCDYIRNTMGNSVGQIYIRTGQPGIAPERDVIDELDITGYFTKVEATEDKLYTIIKSGVRQYIFSVMSMYMTAGLQASINLSFTSQEQFGQTMGAIYGQLIAQRGAEGSGCAMWAGESLVWCAGYSSVAEAEALRDELLQLPAIPLLPTGESMHLAPEIRNGVLHDGILVVPQGETNQTTLFLSSGNSRPKGNILYALTASTVRGISTLWESAGQRAYAQ